MEENGGKWEVVTNTSWKMYETVPTRTKNGGKWCKNGGQMGEKWDTDRSHFSHFPKGNLLPHRAVNKKPSIQLSGWENGGNGGIQRYPENWILPRLERCIVEHAQYAREARICEAKQATRGYILCFAVRRMGSSKELSGGVCFTVPLDGWANIGTGLVGRWADIKQTCECTGTHTRFTKQRLECTLGGQKKVGFAEDTKESFLRYAPEDRPECTQCTVHTLKTG